MVCNLSFSYIIVESFVVHLTQYSFYSTLVDHESMVYNLVPTYTSYLRLWFALHSCLTIMELGYDSNIFTSAKDTKAF